MMVSIDKQDGKTVVRIDGRIDSSNVERFQQEIAPLMEEEYPNIDVDCSNLSYTSSQGLRAFLMLQKYVNNNQGQMVMRNMNPMVKEVFDITGFSNIITIL